MIRCYICATCSPRKAPRAGWTRKALQQTPLSSNRRLEARPYRLKKISFCGHCNVLGSRRVQVPGHQRGSCTTKQPAQPRSRLWAPFNQKIPSTALQTTRKWLLDIHTVLPLECNQTGFYSWLAYVQYAEHRFDQRGVRRWAALRATGHSHGMLIQRCIHRTLNAANQLLRRRRKLLLEVTTRRPWCGCLTPAGTAVTAAGHRRCGLIYSLGHWVAGFHCFTC